MIPGPWLTVLLLAGAVVAWAPGSAVVGARVRRLVRGGGTARARGEPAPGAVGDRRRRWLLSGAAGLATALLLGGVLGLTAAAAVAVGVEHLLRRAGPDPDAAARAALARDLPAACDLLAVCLAAGLPVAGALAAVADAVPAPLGPRLRHVAALQRLGAEPRQAWADAPAELGGLGRALVRAGESGAAAVPALRALAAESRAGARAGAEAAVQRAGVWVLAPLGLCFLPAFVCLGVVPLVLGIAGDVFG
ncbi:type II secretion system F family protein [Blastococcus saxobsidens]|uniref:Type II secretion system F domain protein n=1 Tax=Blastococcus saxobsidens (strain DD2) TaxID=1146883 RepID=H6RPU9_BLASD|nr:type II secretion system F family protein [Blastococcus saxobsidens]CCG01518.1 Type II secretion system F domain protein [Blastococcus saxobsidens DD2]